MLTFFLNTLPIAGQFFERKFKLPNFRLLHQIGPFYYTLNERIHEKRPGQYLVPHVG
jgi:hypothetical protein